MGGEMNRPVFVVLHIPKCAGSTIETHLAEHLGTRFWSPRKRSRRFPLEIFGRKYDARPPVPPHRIRAVSGHFLGASIKRLFAPRPLHCSVLLRDPRQLMLSWYNFRMMRYLDAGQSPYPFSTHMRALPSDPMAHFLLEQWFELPWWRIARLQLSAKIAMLDSMLSQFDFVGDISDCDALTAQISRALGIPENAERKNTSADWQKRVAWTPVRYEDLSEADRRALEARTRLDNYLWRKWALGQSAKLSIGDVASFMGNEMLRPIYEIRRKTRRARPNMAKGTFTAQNARCKRSQSSL